MVIEWTGIIAILLILLSAMGIIKLIDLKLKMTPEMNRKAFHVTIGLVMLTLPYVFESALSVGVLATLSVLSLLIMKKTKLKESIGNVLYGVERESLGEVFFAISIFLIFYLSKGNQVLYSIPILILTFADSTAALIGKSYGKKNLAEQNEDAKSIEGSFMFFMVAFMATLVPLLLFTTVGREETLIISLIIGFNVALIEMISHGGNDNLLIPLTTFAFLSTHINLPVESLRLNLVILGVIFILVRIINGVKAWSKLALVESLVVGYLTVSLYGIYGIIPPLMLLFTSMILPARNESEKNTVYDARIIETNVVLGVAICGIAAVMGLKKELFLVYVLAYSMHSAINGFVRLKYFFNLCELKCCVYAFLKAVGLVYLPGIFVQKIVFSEFPSLPMIIITLLALMLSVLFILLEKKDVVDEEVSIKNGYMHTKIAFALTAMVGVIQYLTVL